MPVVNKYGVPETIVRALHKQNELYDAGPVDISVTSLIAPARVTTLKRKHHKEIITDVADSLWALFGSAIHYLLEQGAGPNMVVEERLFMKIDGWTISGAIDCQEMIGEQEVDITDYKTTSKYAVLDKEGKDEWVAQLNLHALLVESNKPKHVRNLNICAIIRDWSSSEAKRDPMYPQAPIIMIPIPRWSRHKQIEYARSRIEAHKAARAAEVLEEPMAECSPEERWAKNDKWAVMKEGNKKASVVCDSREDAEAAIAAFMEKDKKKSSYSIDYREGQSVRCSYCGVHTWCDQYARMNKGEEEEE